MKKLEYYIPPFVVDSSIYFNLILKYGSHLSALKKNRRIRDVKSGKSVYVLANGPSLNNFDLQLLYGKDVIVMNHFELAEWKDKVNIVAHCIGEPFKSLAWEDPSPMINGTNAESYWLHVSALKDILENHAYQGKNYNFLYPAIPSGLWGEGRRVRLDKPTLGYQTTAQMSIMVGMYMGYTKIYLLGFDHDWLCQRNVSPHFYAERDNVPKADLSKFSYFQLIKFSMNMWNIYLKIRASADKAGIQIVNLSRPTYLDVFDFQ